MEAEDHANRKKTRCRPERTVRVLELQDSLNRNQAPDTGLEPDIAWSMTKAYSEADC
jgi:hypothetical protein